MVRIQLGFKNILSALVCVLLIGLVQTAQANVEVKFIESAPKDSFVITNKGKCLLQDLTLQIDLSKSVGRLIFDTTASGEGVEVFQPFEVVQGNIALISKSGVMDGDAKLSLSIPNMPAGESVSFTIDVDDTLPKSELGKIRVAGSEIKNGMVEIRLGKQQPMSALFGSDSKSVISLPSC